MPFKELIHPTQGIVKLGCKHRLNLKALPLGNYLTPSQMSYPPVCSWWRPVNFGMLGNDTVGDCVIAWMLHQIIVWKSVAHSSEKVEFTTEQAIQTYSAITGYIPSDPNTDQGTDPDSALQYWQTTGLFGDKIDGYVNLDITNLDQLRYAIYVFGGIGLSFDVPAYIMNVPGGQSWSYTDGADVTIEGGHQVGWIGYGRQGGRENCWNTTNTFNYDFVSRFGRAAQAAVSGDWIKQSGVSPTGLDLEGLLGDLKTV